MILFLAPLIAASFALDIQQPFGAPGQGGAGGAQAGGTGQAGGRQGGRRQGGVPGGGTGAPTTGQTPGGGTGAPTTGAPTRTGPMLERIPWVKTKHSITIHGNKIDYTATCGWLPIRDGAGEVTANMFFVEYSKDDVDAKKRPVLFAFNGGPGSSSMWLHMGTIGPRRAHMNDDGSMPQPPFDVVDNEETWLGASDLVMLDAIGTGYSRPASDTDRSFYGLQGDLAGFTAGIKEFINREHRWGSPKFVAGESYGGMRVAGLSYSLLQAGIALNGIVSISGVMNDATLDNGRFNDLPYFSFLPSEAAVAWYHKRLSPHYQNMTVEALCAEVEKFTTGEYAATLNEGSMASPKDRQDVVNKLSAYTGIPKSYFATSNMRIRAGAFMAELLRDQNLSTGRYDGRLLGHTVDPSNGRSDFDASDAATTPVFIAGFNEYVDGELKFHPAELGANLDYRGTAYQFVGGWDYGGRTGYPDTSQDLQRCMDQNKYMKVMLCCGRYDLACPYMGMRYVMAHLGQDPALANNISFQYYLAGHMMYIEKGSRTKLQHDIENFVSSAVPH